MTCHNRFIESGYYYLPCCLYELWIVLMALPPVVVTLLMSVPFSPCPLRSTSPMPHHFIIVDTAVVFHLPNSWLYHNQSERPCNDNIWYDVRPSVSVVALLLICHLTFPSRVVHHSAISIRRKTETRIYLCHRPQH